MTAARERILRAGLLSLAAWGLVNLLWTVILRAGSRWPLEWMEGGSMHHAARLLAGKGLYVEPSAEFIPYLYPPLAYLPMALSMHLFGPSLLAARLPSLVWLGLTLALLARAGGRLSGSRIAGAAAASVFAIGYGYAGAFMDLARVDAMFMACLALGLDSALARRRWLALLAFALASLCKQHGGLFLIAYSAAELARQREALRPIAIAALSLGATMVALQLSSAGWFARYVIELPGEHGIEPPLLLSFFVVDVVLYLPALCVATLWWLRRGGDDARILAWCLCAGLLAGALGRAHPGGHDNVRLPALLMLALIGGSALSRVVLDRARTTRSRVVVLLAAVGQFALLWQAPHYHKPPRGSARAFAALAAALDRCAGGAARGVALDLPLLAGRPFLHTMALSDLRLGHDRELFAQASYALLARLVSPEAPAAIAVGERFAALSDVLDRRYRECARLPTPRFPPGGYTPGLLIHGTHYQVIYRPTNEGHSDWRPSTRSP